VALKKKDRAGFFGGGEFADARSVRKVMEDTLKDPEERRIRHVAYPLVC